MIKIALLGSDSTHTEAFASRINGRESVWQGRAEVVSIWGEDPRQTRDKASALGIGRVCATMDEALEDVDFAMVIGRFADSHFVPAKRALERGVATFVDKPFTPNRGQAEELAELARKTGTKLCSSSPLRFAKELRQLKGELDRAGDDWLSAVVTVPANCTDLGPDPRLDSAFFYGIHGLEMLLELVGHDFSPPRVAYFNTVISAHFELASGRTAVFQLVRDTVEFYRTDLYTRTKALRTEVDLETADFYDDELRFLLEEFLPGHKTIPLESSIRAIALLEEIDRDDPVRAVKHP